MPRHCVSASSLINAPAARLYSIIADYRDGHAKILPRPPFVSMDVTCGGFGAGTEIDVAIRIMGRTSILHGVVSEPEAGRVIQERYAGTDIVTTFTVEPRDDGQSALVTIRTDIDLGTGVKGVVGRWLATRLLKPVYARELDRLAALASVSRA